MLTALAFALSLAQAAPAEGGTPRMFQTLPAATQRCGTPLAATGKAVALTEPLDETTRTGLLAGVHLTLRGPAETGWPDADVKAAQACPIARFAASDLVWTIHSGAGAAPLRVIVNEGREDAFVLVRGPSIAAAAEWYEARGGPAPPASAYYLFAKLERMHYLVKLYDGPPGMETVAADIGALMENEAATLAFYEASGRTWLDKDGNVQLVLFMRDGEYVYEIRQTHAPGEVKAADETMLALIEQIAGPDPEPPVGGRRRR